MYFENIPRWKGLGKNGILECFAPPIAVDVNRKIGRRHVLISEPFDGRSLVEFVQDERVIGPASTNIVSQPISEMTLFRLPNGMVK